MGRAGRLESSLRGKGGNAQTAWGCGESPPRGYLHAVGTSQEAGQQPQQCAPHGGSHLDARPTHERPEGGATAHVRGAG